MRSKHQQSVEEFMTLARQKIPPVPTIPSQKVRELRAKLIMEEALETVEALGFRVIVTSDTINRVSEKLHQAYFYSSPDLKPSLMGVADGCADLSVVTIGTLSACGINDIPLLRTVDKANLRKFTEPHCPICQKLMSVRGVDTLGRDNDVTQIDRWYCSSCTRWEPLEYGGHRRSDGKWVKGTSFIPPDIELVLMEQGWTPPGKEGWE